jgi:hypothetical protein
VSEYGFNDIPFNDDDGDKMTSKADSTQPIASANKAKLASAVKTAHRYLKSHDDGIWDIPIDLPDSIRLILLELTRAVGKNLEYYSTVLPTDGHAALTQQVADLQAENAALVAARDAFDKAWTEEKAEVARLREEAGDEKARDWLIGRMEYVQLQGDILIEAKDGDGYIAILNSDSEYDRETLGAFDTIAEAVEAITEALAGEKHDG